MKGIITKKELERSLAQFVLHKTDPKTEESAVELYQRWNAMSGISITDPDLAAFILEFLDRQKYCDREVLLEAAKHYRID